MKRSRKRLRPAPPREWWMDDQPWKMREYILRLAMDRKRRRFILRNWNAHRTYTYIRMEWYGQMVCHDPANVMVIRV